MSSKSLTPKQEKAARKYVECGDKSEAYRFAYDTSRMKPASVNRVAHRLFEQVKIRSRIEELQAEIAERHDLTVDGIIQQLIEDRDFARACGSASAAVKVTELLGKHLGMFAERLRHEFDEKVPLLLIRNGGEEDERVA